MTTTKMNRARRNWLLAVVAGAALPAATIALAPAAGAQVQQQTTGRALDANNRIGSGGVNTYAPPPRAGVYGNNVINGNVTAGREFRGFVGYSDPNEFRGFVAGKAVSDFQKDSAGVGVPNTPPPVPNQSVSFYSDSRYAPPPQPGFTAAPTPPGTGGGYVEAKPLVISPGDARLGSPLDAAPTTTVPKAGEMVLPGPIDPTSRQQTFLSASPLTGVRQLNSGDAGDLAYLQKFSGAARTSDNVLDRARISPEQMQKARQELLGASDIGGTSIGAKPLPRAGTGSAAEGSLTGSSSQQNLAKPLGQPLEAPSDPLLLSRRVDNSMRAATVDNTISSDTGVYSRLVGSPSQQSTQYDELKKRLERYQAEHKSTAEAGTEQYNLAVKAKREAEEKAAAAAAMAKKIDPSKTAQQGTTPVKLPGDDNQVTDATKSPTATQPPVQIKSMGKGIQGKGLKDMLDQAEALMKEGKFTPAIDKYAAAEQVAPNQPLIWMGRANAELGAAYYGRAEAHLKQAFASDKALLMAQYDLRSFLGEDRLQSVVKDLKEIASSDQSSPTPVFLLAYVAYNTGNERRAAAYLDMAEKRSDGKDPSYKTLREYWTLPTTDKSTTPATENKGAELNK
jgi:hypothetical protein